MKTLIRTLTAAFALALAAAPAVVDAQALPGVRFQGQLSDLNGQPAAGPLTLTFSLYDRAQGGVALWSETHQVNLVNGEFDVALGAGANPLTADYFTGPTWIGIAPQGQPEFLPRQPVGDVPVALLARDVVGSIHPREVWVGGVLVIDEDGNWVGPGAGPGGGGVGDFPLGQDTDGDGFEDWIELTVDSDPADVASTPADADDNGVPDLLQGPKAPPVPSVLRDPRASRVRRGSPVRPAPRGLRGRRASKARPARRDPSVRRVCRGRPAPPAPRAFRGPPVLPVPPAPPVPPARRGPPGRATSTSAAPARCSMASA